MKLSYYNFLSKCKSNGAILYNSRTGCMVKLDDVHYQKYSAFGETHQQIPESEFAIQLKECGFLVDDNVSELEQIRYRLLQARYSSNLLSLVIAPTQDCNFRCTYCYEKDQLACCYMSSETQENIIKFVAQRAEHITALNIQWYGGEPLLALDIIQHLSDAFFELCEKYNIKYSSDIITNGYLLNEDTINKLNSLRISRMQITLDGGRDTHDQRRKLCNGAPTFDTIFKNLILCKDIYTGKIALRMNVDKQNLSEIAQIKNALIDVGLDAFVTLYLGKVTNINGTCQEASCLQTCEYAQHNLAFMIEQDSAKELFWANYPSPLGNRCGADFNQSYIIGPDGSMYKCHMDIGNADCAVGNINENAFKHTSTLHQYILFDPTQDQQCSKCKFLPLCMGGCIKARLSGYRDCTEQKHYLSTYMKYIPTLVGEHN